MLRFLILFILLISFNSLSNSSSAMDKKHPYHHVYDEKGKFVAFRNGPGVPEWNKNRKWPRRKFNEERKKVKVQIPKDFVIKREDVLKNMEANKSNDYLLWIGHNTFLLKINNTNILFDPWFEKRAGFFGLFGPKRFLDPAIKVSDLPKIDVILISHSHLEHFSRDFRERYRDKKNTKVIVPLRMGPYYTKYGYKNVQELDWRENIKINGNIKITAVEAIHWSRSALMDLNRTGWQSYLITLPSGKTILFGCDTGIYKDVYKRIGKETGKISLATLNIGSWDFRKAGIESTIYHAKPSEALQIGQQLSAEKVIAAHTGNIVLSFEDPFENFSLFKSAASQYGYNDQTAITLKHGELRVLENLLN